MNAKRMSMLATAFFALLAMCASLANAQTAHTVLKGKFTLSSEVSWQGTLLPAGEYTFTMESAAYPAQIIIRGQNRVAIVGARGISDGNSSEPSALTVEHRGAASFVRELRIASLSLVLSYSVPKLPKEELARAAVSVERIPISASQK